MRSCRCMCTVWCAGLDHLFSRVTVRVESKVHHCQTLVSAPDPFLRCACAKGGVGRGGKGLATWPCKDSWNVNLNN